MLLTRRTIQLATLSMLLVGFVFTTSSALAFWEEATVIRDVEIITIGEPIEIVVDSINEIGDIYLVPEGRMIAVGDVEYVEFEYSVGVSRELLSEVDLNIAINDVLIGDDDTYSHLVEIDILGFGEEATLSLYNDVLTIGVTVRLLEPFDAAEVLEEGLDPSLVNVDDSVLAFETIAGQDITFSLSFMLIEKTEIDNN